MSFIWYIIIGIVAGFVAGKLMRGGGFGLRARSPHRVSAFVERISVKSRVVYFKMD